MFSKIFKYLLVALSVLTAFSVSIWLIAPYVLNMPIIRHEIQSQLSSHLGHNAVIGRISINIFPVPTMSIDRASFNITKTASSSLRLKDISIGLYDLNVYVPSLFSSDAIYFSSDVTVKQYITAPFHIKGIFNWKDKGLDLEIDSGDRKMDLSGLIKRLFPENAFSCKASSMRLRLKWRPNGLLHIDNIDIVLKKPSLSVRGSVEINIKGERLKADLSFSANKLSQIREILLKNFSYKKEVRETFDILREGNIATLNVLYNGDFEGLKHFENFYLKGKGRDFCLFIPKIGFFINDVTGVIEIKNGTLTGDGLIARVRGANGDNISVLVDISGRKEKRIRVKADLSASYDDINWSLSKFVKDKEARDALSSIRAIGGRAYGQLEVFGPLKHPSVKVIAAPVRLKFNVNASFMEALHINNDIELLDGKALIDTQKRAIYFNELSGKIDSGKGSFDALSSIISWAEKKDDKKTGIVTETGDNAGPKRGGEILIEVKGILLDVSLFNRMFKRQAINGLNASNTSYASDALNKQASDKMSLRGTVLLKNLIFHAPLRGISAKNIEISSQLSRASIYAYIPMINKTVLITGSGGGGGFYRDKAFIKNIGLFFDDNSSLLVSAYLFARKIAGYNVTAKGRPKRKMSFLKMLSGKVSLSGSIKSKIGAELFSYIPIPDGLLPVFPIEDIKADITLMDGKMQIFEANCTINRQIISLRLLDNGGSIDIMPFKIADNKGNGALMRLGIEKKRHNISLIYFNGLLTKEMLDAVLKENIYLSGSISGRFWLNRKGSAWNAAEARGRLMVKDFWWREGVKRPILLKSLIIDAGDKPQGTIYIKDIILSDSISSANGARNRADGRGKIEFSSDGVSIYLNAHSADLNISKVISLFYTKRETLGESILLRKKKKLRNSWLNSLSVLFHVDKARYERFPIEDAIGAVSYSPYKGVSVNIESGRMCSLHIALDYEYLMEDEANWMRIKAWTAKDSSLGDYPSQNGASIDSALKCLDINNVLTGRFSASLELEGAPTFWKKGHFFLKARDGIIKYNTLFSKIFSVLNVIDLFSPEGLSRLLSPSLFYDLIEIDGPIKNNMLLLQKLNIKAEGFNFFGQGRYGIANNDLDIELLISPLKAVDFVLSNLPLIGYAIGGKNRTLVTVPVKITGTLSEPAVSSIGPESVSKGVLDMFKNVITIPVRILMPEKTQTGPHFDVNDLDFNKFPLP